MKILISALSGIGDTLMFTPALNLLRRELPDAEIHALVMFKGVQQIYESNPDLNKVIHFDFMKQGAVPSFRFLAAMRKKYDASINVYPSNRKEYNLISYFLSAPERAAVKYLRKDWENLGWLNNIRVTESDTRHNVQTNIMLVEKLLGKSFTEEPPMKIYLNEPDISFAKGFLRQHNIKEEDTVIGFHPGCATLKNHIKRRWEPEKFAALAKKLINESAFKVLIFGGPEENDLKENIVRMTASDNAIPVYSPSLTSGAALMKRSNVFVTNDSSLMHVGSALNLNIVAILGPTNPAYIHPWKTNYSIVRLDLECSPCFIYSPRPLICFRNDILFKCIKELDLDMVYNSIHQFLNK